MHEDDLARAVDGRIDTYRPDRVPAFAALQERKRTQDRRRAGTAAVALSVVAVAGIAFAGPALTGNVEQLSRDVAAPATPTVNTGPAAKGYEIRYADGALYANERDRPLIAACFALPGTSGLNARYSLPPQYVMTVTGADQIRAFEQCLDGVPNLTVKQGPGQPDLPATTSDPVAIERLPYTLSADGRELTVSVPVGGGCQLTGIATVTAEEAESAVTLRATVARPEAPSPSPLPPGVERACPANLVTQPVTVRLERPLSNRFVLDGLTEKQLVPAQDSPGAFTERCVGADRGQAGPVEGYVGVSEAEIDRQVARVAPDIRVLGRNGECLGRTRDLRPERINVLIAGGTVIWAGRF